MCLEYLQMAQYQSQTGLRIYVVWPGVTLFTAYFPQGSQTLFVQSAVWSEEANWSGSALFVIQYVNLYQ